MTNELIFCSICDAPITDDSYHDSHDERCLNFGRHKQEDSDDALECACDRPCHAECCPECGEVAA